MSPRAILAAAVAGLIAGGPAIAAAQPHSGEVTVHAPTKAPYSGGRERKSEVVHFTDLNLASADGAQSLYRRLSAATEHVCMPLPNRGNLKDAEDYSNCTTNALRYAVQDINNPALTQVYQAETTK